MLILAIKALIVLLGISIDPTILGNTFTADPPRENIIYIFLLLAIIATALSQYYNIKKLTTALVSSYVFFSFLHPNAFVFLPMLFFDLATHFPFKYTIFLPLIFIVTSDGNIQITLFRTLVGIVSLILAYLFLKVAELDVVNKEIRDTNESQKIILTLKNQKLLERQNDEIHMTKLQERNRIARDIHDTIGHSLSRALLQTGAISAINQNEEMNPAIDALKETLSLSMNSIRNSIHDLKDDSIDLKTSMAKILEETEFKTSFSYDVEGELPNDIKNCFLIVLKESITNTRRHSDATRITVTVAEHPAIYQLLVADNGTKEPGQTDHGIGLQNINERVSELDGYCRMSYQGGFRTFITIPKE